MRQFLITILYGILSSIPLSAQVITELTRPHTFTSDIEGPMIDKQGNLFVVNLGENGTIGRVFPDGSTKLFVTLPAGSTANAIQFTSGGDMLLADWTAHQILKVDCRSLAISVYCKADFNQPNDITIHRKGFLFASDPNWKEGTGKLWRIDTLGNAILLKDKMGTTNGITLSPDQKTLYVNESVQRKIWAFKLDKEGNLSAQSLFYQFPDFGLDGMKCDKGGNLWVTRHGKGTIVVLSAHGKLIRELTLKGMKPSNLVFTKNEDGCFVTMQDHGNLNWVKFKN